jgi:hypothetical protein
MEAKFLAMIQMGKEALASEEAEKGGSSNVKKEKAKVPTDWDWLQAFGKTKV